MLRIMSKSLNSDITKLITKYLSIREHSKLELKNKLIEKGFDIEEILLSINESDSRFTEEFIRSRIKKNKGPNLISSELNCRGITEALISENLSKISHDQWLDCAFVALRKKLKGSSITLEDRDKIYSFLIGRGFEHKMIKYALDEYNS